jgi:hypothetical protein
MKAVNRGLTRVESGVALMPKSQESPINQYISVLCGRSQNHNKITHNYNHVKLNNPRASKGRTKCSICLDEGIPCMQKLILDHNFVNRTLVVRM